MKKNLNLIILFIIILGGALLRFFASEHVIEIIAGISSLSLPLMFVVTVVSRRKEKKDQSLDSE